MTVCVVTCSNGFLPRFSITSLVISKGQFTQAASTQAGTIRRKWSGFSFGSIALPARSVLNSFQAFPSNFSFFACAEMEVRFVQQPHAHWNKSGGTVPASHNQKCLRFLEQLTCRLMRLSHLEKLISPGTCTRQCPSESVASVSPGSIQYHTRTERPWNFRTKYFWVCFRWDCFLFILVPNFWGNLHTKGANWPQGRRHGVRFGASDYGDNEDGDVWWNPTPLRLLDVFCLCTKPTNTECWTHSARAGSSGEAVPFGSHSETDFIFCSTFHLIIANRKTGVLIQ